MELSTGIRERTRRAIQREIGEAALALFLERGYDNTTIADVAAAVGMSQRSVFRYFRTKEEIVVSKMDLVVEPMQEVLRARPPDEPVWVSLRRLFFMLDQPDTPKTAEQTHRIILETPALLAAYLGKLQQMQEAVVDVVYERAAAIGKPYTVDDPAPRALMAAAFGCLVAAQHSWLASGTGTLGEAIDRAMATLAPQA
ncbi:TetR/AcrR family transcriptional regulator [Amycolatopsis speibonae]|uniref:TetR/AcrR family transcriptional regulator n=1 Tax=Amycolatopsis speibonae TaxID=1450224 RepID=A0ABV7P404_9PSEU